MLARAWLCLSWLAFATLSAAVPSYIASAIQYSPVGTYKDAPSDVIKRNLAAHVELIQQAAEAGAQIAVFSEGSMGMFLGLVNRSRDTMLQYCESIPNVDPSHVVNPCIDGGNWGPQLRGLSCGARSGGVVVVADICDVQPCHTASDPRCPSDSRYQYNTQVAFDEAGNLVAKYHKSHLFGESVALDAAPPSAVTFTTSFGVTFGMLVCFDMEFPEPVTSLLSLGVRDIVFSSWWLNLPPATSALGYQQSFSRIYDVNLIAANTGASASSGGGGVFSRGQPLNTVFNTSANSVSIVTSKMPILQASCLTKSDATPSSAPPPSPPALLDLPEPSYASSSHASSSFASFSFTSSPSVHSAEYRPCSWQQGFGNCSFFSISNCPSFPCTINLQVVNGSLSCDGSLTIAQPPPAASPDRWALVALQNVMHYPDTPIALDIFACAIIPCDAKGSSCPAVRSSSVDFSRVSLRASNLPPQHVVFPMLSVNKAQVTDSAYWQYAESTSKLLGTPARAKTATITVNKPLPEPMLSTIIFAVADGNA